MCVNNQAVRKESSSLFDGGQSTQEEPLSTGLVTESEDERPICAEVHWARHRSRIPLNKDCAGGGGLGSFLVHLKLAMTVIRYYVVYEMNDAE